MKIAVLGGGTAGTIAAAHLSKVFPDVNLLHIYSSKIPTIGVGEGTTPRFPLWLKQLAGIGLEELSQRCGATLKRGTHFEGWGNAGLDFFNRFQPTRLTGFHLDAGRVIGLLSDFVSATYIDRRVNALSSGPRSVKIHFEDGPSEEVDFVFDARGFPPPEMLADPGQTIPLPWIPTSDAMLRRLPAGTSSGSTRVIARPHGWVFLIPIREWTSCGYVHNRSISTAEDVAADFDEFLAERGIETFEARGQLSFPTFARRDVFDGRVFILGNAASFIEPLEGTAIGTAIVAMRSAQEHLEGRDPSAPADSNAIAAYNAEMRSYVLRNSLFVAWHYACGSRWDSPFWRHAAEKFAEAQKNPSVQQHCAEMDEFVDAGRELPGLALPHYDDPQKWDREIYPLLKRFIPFGNFSELNFAQVGHGMGYYGSATEGAHPAGLATQR
ncbi:MAG: tryptophan 7-halogenase [Pseudomonadota bacterium]